MKHCLKKVNKLTDSQSRSGSQAQATCTHFILASNWTSPRQLAVTSHPSHPANNQQIIFRRTEWTETMGNRRSLRHQTFREIFLNYANI